MTGVVESESLVSALQKAAFPAANHEFIGRITDAVGISEFRFVPAAERYIAATRRDGHGELRIYSGYTIRFLDGNEARRVGVGADTIRESFKPHGGWLVSHPIHGDLDRRDVATRSTRQAGMCPEEGCGYQLSANGVCPSGEHDD